MISQGSDIFRKTFALHARLLHTARVTIMPAFPRAVSSTSIVGGGVILRQDSTIPSLPSTSTLVVEVHPSSSTNSKWSSSPTPTGNTAALFEKEDMATCFFKLSMSFSGEHDWDEDTKWWFDQQHPHTCIDWAMKEDL